MMLYLDTSVLVKLYVAALVVATRTVAHASS